MSGVLRTVAKVAGIASTIATLSGNPGLGATLAVVAAAASPAADILALPPEQGKTMTAITMLADRRRAYLITDGAAFNVQTGAVAAIEAKVLAFPAISLAIAIQGWGTTTRLMEAMNEAAPAPTLAGFLSAMPQALAAMRLGSPAPPAVHTRLWAAAYDRARATSVMVTVQSGAMPDGDGAPFTVEASLGGVTGLSNADLAAIVPDGWPSDPVHHGIPILRAQRSRPFGSIAGGCGVGGECGAWTIDRRGVRYQPLLRFADRVGERADPTAAGELLTGMRPQFAAFAGGES